MAEELTAVAFQRCGVQLKQRLVLLHRRTLALGFGVPLVLLLLLPVAAVFLMPGAAAGATLMVRDLVDDAGSGAWVDVTPHALTQAG